MRRLTFFGLWAVLMAAACGNNTNSTATASTDIVMDAQVSDIDASTADVPPVDVAAKDVTSPVPDAVKDSASPTDVVTTADVAALDVAADVPAAACVPTYEGSIPGATLDLSKTTCSFSIAAAKGVFNLGYRLTVATSEKLSVGGNLGGCPPSPGSVHGGVATFEQIDGGGQKWCMCDTGLCAPVEPPFVASTPGGYDVVFPWDGKNFQGPSDTGNKPGPAFPPGSYVFSVTVKGNHQKADGTTESFSAVAKLPIVLTP